MRQRSHMLPPATPVEWGGARCLQGAEEGGRASMDGLACHDLT